MLNGDLPDMWCYTAKLQYISPRVPSAQDALARENNKLYPMESFPARHIWQWAVHLSLEH
jgi:hypothetical protein